MSATSGRNDPCPCGSGKKYKKCCLDGGRAGTAAGSTERGGTADIERATQLHALDRTIVEELFLFGETFDGWDPEAAFPTDLEDDPAAAMLFYPWAVYEHRDLRG
jgi:hypothetical protein